jgi:hypothetical protein
MHLCTSTYSSASYRIAEGIPVAVPEEPEEQPEVQEQEVLEADEEVSEDLPECPDHRPSYFERGKPGALSASYFIKHFSIYIIYLMH